MTNENDNNLKELAKETVSQIRTVAEFVSQMKQLASYIDAEKTDGSTASQIPNIIANGFKNGIEGLTKGLEELQKNSVYSNNRKGPVHKKVMTLNRAKPGVTYAARGLSPQQMKAMYHGKCGQYSTLDGLAGNYIDASNITIPYFYVRWRSEPNTNDVPTEEDVKSMLHYNIELIDIIKVTDENHPGMQQTCHIILKASDPDGHKYGYGLNNIHRTRNISPKEYLCIFINKEGKLTFETRRCMDKTYQSHSITVATILNGIKQDEKKGDRFRIFEIPGRYEVQHLRKVRRNTEIRGYPHSFLRDDMGWDGVQLTPEFDVGTRKTALKWVRKMPVSIGSYHKIDDDGMVYPMDRRDMHIYFYKHDLRKYRFKIDRTTIIRIRRNDTCVPGDWSYFKLRGVNAENEWKQVVVIPMK